ncbi:receptor-type tyrosine-protein phosphatase mu-like [Mytilus californianus]|uniref:receptor-type tyrosine-protein phosphatase mu-like n=1 Tax=Mytilus californianus TaxID=6549 RepID=UPI0022485EC1|nr:receptor-type tyrosine-protein phosphatase mu-like [Mytilus californianus]
MKQFVIAVVLIILRVYVCDDETAIVGTTIQLLCQFLNGSKWQKFDSPTGFWKYIYDGAKYSGTSSRALTISNFQIEDSGNYRCLAGMTGPGGNTTRLNPEIPTFIDSTVTLTCTLSGTTLYWYIIDKNGLRTLSDNDKYDISSTNSLKIITITADDFAIYYCQPLNGMKGPQITVSLSDWSIWTAWGDCNATCGIGERHRTRICSGTCTGEAVQKESCTVQTKTDGGWSSWENSGPCTGSCGNVLQKRIRFCNNPPRANCGEYCQGEDNDYISCLLSACPVDGGWTSWISVGACPVTCGTGLQSRTRYCTNPAPENNGSHCQGEEYDYISCTRTACPVDGGWSTWNAWGACTVTCGTGQQRRRRNCDNPLPANGGASCHGEDYDLLSCKPSECAESNTETEPVAPIAGGVGGGIMLLVIIAVGLIYMKRRRRKPLDDRVSGENQGLQIIDRKVSLRQGGDRHEGMYINIARASRQSSSDTDDAIPSSRVSTKVINTDKINTYYNNADILTTVKIDELKDYIKQKQVNEGLHSEYKTIPYGPQHPTTTAQKKENMPKNRFKTTFPYDHTRVILQPVPGSQHMDYINASLVDGFEKESCYIASQGPLKHTFTDFWAMIWQNNTRKIIMLTNLMEVAKVKCDKYWPEGGKPMALGNLILTLQSEKERAAYVTREISVEDKKTKEKRNIIQYHFTAWPDHGTPDPLYLVLFHKHVISDHSDVESGKLLVHCSAGIGRTGTYIGLDALYEEGRVTGCVDIVKFVKKMRYSRMNMVQTPEQYVCLHYALLEAFTMKDTNIGKEEFGKIWREIQSDKQPINHQKLYKEFKMLEAKTSEHGKSEYTAATSPENMEKNRNKTIIPSDNNRLFLTTYDKGRTDYINAVQAPSYTKFVGYLMTQLPLPETKIDFWTMIRDHNSSTIVMFINEQTEAELVYATSDDTFSCGSFTMKITRRENDGSDISSCTVVMSRKDEKSKEIVIYYAVCSGYPKPSVLCKLVNLISTRVSMSHDAVTVVSGDGAKSCGLFCTFSNAVSSMTIDDNADIFQLARLLQLRRPEFFADFDEYRLCYEALNFYLESSNVYANF